MPPMLGGTRIRRSLTAVISASAVFALIFVSTLPTATVSSAATRSVSVSSKSNSYTDSGKKTAVHRNVSTAKVDRTRFATYFALRPVTVGSGESVSSATLTVRIKKAASASKGRLQVRVVTKGWTGGKVTYKSRPKLGAVLGTARLKKSGNVTINLNAKAAKGYLAPGLKIQIVRTGSNQLVTLAKSAVLKVTITSGASTGTNINTTGKITDKPVFAHYFTPYPISIDNYAPANDYYSVNYLKASGESGKFASVGGLLRDRPLTRNPITSGDYEAVDMATEVAQARAGGINGFAVDLLTFNTSSKLWKLTVKLMAAANKTDGNFKIMLQPDMYGLTTTTSEFAQAIATLSQNESVYRLSTGEVVISPFLAEAKSAAWYSEAISILKTKYQVSAVLLPLLLDASKMSSYASISIGFGNWGERDATVINNSANYAAAAHNLGKMWMEPVSVQDERPSGSIYDEAWNTQTLRAGWNKAITQGADMVLIPTWNDYSEGTSIAPSVDHGTTFLTVSKYYLTRFRTGSYPAVTSDSVHIIHRIQKYSTMPTSYTNVMKRHYATGGSASRDKVEVVTFLTSSATVTVTIGGKATSYTAPAGFNAALFDLAEGYSTATAERSGSTVATVTTKDAVSFTTEQQDLSYHAVSS
jgi:hypothetical protein